MIGGAWRGCETILRGSGLAATGDAVTGRAGGGTGGRTFPEWTALVPVAAEARPPDPGAFAAPAPAAEAGGRTTTGEAPDRCGNCACRSASCFRARIAFLTSPGLEMLERSILGRLSCSLLALAEDAGREPRSK